MRISDPRIIVNPTTFAQTIVLNGYAIAGLAQKTMQLENG